MNILVTAVGSELAFSVIKAIKLFGQPFKLFGCDIYKEVVGKYWCDKFFNVPLAKDEMDYISSIIAIIKQEDIKIIIPTADAEFIILSKYKQKFKDELNCNILIQDLGEINRFNDKWLSYKWYIKMAIPTPKTFLGNSSFKLLKKELSRIKYPLIIKPRIGGGSRHIYKINSFKDIIKFLPLVPKPIIQEYLFPDEDEYTAGTYRTQSNEVYSIILKRSLKFGMTNTAKTIFNSDLEKFCRDTILNTKLSGSNNIQFRITPDGPKILEINPRFSGTTGIRASFGFNDVEMWINEVLLNIRPQKPFIKKGFVLRHMEEQYHFHN